MSANCALPLQHNSSDGPYRPVPQTSPPRRTPFCLFWRLSHCVDMTTYAFRSAVQPSWGAPVLCAFALSTANLAGGGIDIKDKPLQAYLTTLSYVMCPCAAILVVNWDTGHRCPHAHSPHVLATPAPLALCHVITHNVSGQIS